MKRNIKPILIGLTAFPIIFLLLLICHFHVDTPIWDSWRMVPLFEKMYNRELSWQDFWQQHNEHRLIFLRLIVLFLGRLTDWNTLYEILLNVFIVLVMLLLIYKQFKTNFPKLTWLYLMPILSWLLFSISQFESWMLGFTNHIFMHQLAVVTAAWHLTQKHLTWKNILWLTIFSIVATFSFGSALIIWPISLLFLIFSTNLKPLIKQKIIIVWLIVSLAIILTYLNNYQTNTPPFWLTFINNPVSVTMFTLLFIGRPLTIFLYLDTFWGIVVTVYAIALTTGMIVTLINRRFLTIQQIKPIIFYIIFTAGTAFVIALGRAQYGYEAARASRYITVANLFWVGIFAIWFIFYYFVVTQTQYQKYLIRSLKYLPFIFTVFTLMLILSSAKSIHLFNLLSLRYQKERNNILNYASGGQLTVYSYDADFLKRNIEFLQRYKLSVFRNH